MDFLTAIKTCFRKYADFTGRASRPEFWWFALFTFLVMLAIDLVLPGNYFAAGFTTDDPSELLAAYGSPASTVNSIFSLAVLLPSLAVSVRRLRDSGRHWANMFWAFLPLAGIVILIVQWCQPSVPAVGYAAPYGQPGQPGPYGQQAGYAQPGPYAPQAQPGAYGQPGAYPQAPYGQQAPPYGQQPAGYGQQAQPGAHGQSVAGDQQASPYGQQPGSAQGQPWPGDATDAAPPRD